MSEVPLYAQERTTFMEKLADFAGRPDKEGLRKNFYRLSHYLPNKTCTPPLWGYNPV